MTEEELRTVLDNLLQIQSNNDYNFQILQAQVDRLQKQLDDLNDLKEMFRLPNPANKNREPFEQIDA
jgi:prefoldin subunit 5